MPAIYETAYPRIKSRLTAKELAQIYTPTDEDLQFIKKQAKQPASRLGLLIMLKIFQRLGYFLLRASAVIPNCLKTRDRNYP